MNSSKSNVGPTHDIHMFEKIRHQEGQTGAKSVEGARYRVYLFRISFYQLSTAYCSDEPIWKTLRIELLLESLTYRRIFDDMRPDEQC